MEYLDYLPGFFRESREFIRLGEGLWPAVRDLCGAAEDAAREGVPETASEEGVRRFEKALGLTPGAEDTLEQRRLRVLGVFTGNPPFSMGWLRQKLELAFGPEGYLAEDSAAGHWLRVGADLSKGYRPEALEQELREKIPANLVLRMVGMNLESQGVFAGAVLQTAAVYQLEVTEDGAVSS